MIVLPGTRRYINWLLLLYYHYFKLWENLAPDSASVEVRLQLSVASISLASSWLDFVPYFGFCYSQIPFYNANYYAWAVIWQLILAVHTSRVCIRVFVTSYPETFNLCYIHLYYSFFFGTSSHIWIQQSVKKVWIGAVHAECVNRFCRVILP